MIQWNKVTWYSWALAGIIFLIVVPFLAFYFAAQYKEIEAINVELDQNAQIFRNVKIGNTVIKAELLTTEPQWMQGLSGRKSLTQNTGLLLDFGRANYWGIWMKDMNFPIDVLWITSDLKISDIVENMTPASYPTVYKPHVPVNYVLEIPAGTIKNNNIKFGQAVKFE